jgi:DNA-binding response OmpR family regulator
MSRWHTERSQMATKHSRILYIEDHEDTRDLVSLILTSSNYQVTTAASMGDGLKLAREEHFDLYITDSRLPDGTGIELCKQLRALDDKTPIMFLSGLAYETDKQAALAYGAQCYLVKPADIQVLSNEVKELLAAASNTEAEGVGRSQASLRDDTERAMNLGMRHLGIAIP